MFLVVLSCWIVFRGLHNSFPSLTGVFPFPIFYNIAMSLRFDGFKSPAQIQSLLFSIFLSDFEYDWFVPVLSWILIMLILRVMWSLLFSLLLVSDYFVELQCPTVFRRVELCSLAQNRPLYDSPWIMPKSLGQCLFSSAFYHQTPSV